MIGSLDCSRTHWKNCPKAWQGSYKGKEKKPTIIMEAVADYNLWFWHCSYGHAGTFNDISVLDMSPLMQQFTDGSFGKLEAASKSVPFTISGEKFMKMWLLVDGIYPAYSRFVKTINEPLCRKTKRYAKWQEASRKDIERAFGVLQALWQWTAQLILAHNLQDIGKRGATCIILHNMIVEDRIMTGRRTTPYKPSMGLLHKDEYNVEDVKQPNDLAAVQGSPTPPLNIGNGEDLENCDWEGLIDEVEHQRLHKALIDSFN